MARRLCSAIPLVLCLRVSAHAQTLPPARVAAVGECRLASGDVIHACRVAYREYGTLSAARTNTVLIATWLLGRSDDWPGLIGRDGFVDTTRFHVLIVDALGDGLSSSPSNSSEADRSAFANLTVGDMVESQHQLLRQLGIQHLHAVVGFSMGGMQAIEWAVRHPDFVDRIIPIAGSPRVGAFDRMMWTAMLDEIEDGQRDGLPRDTIWSRLAHLEMLFVQTPVAVNAMAIDSAETTVAMNARQYRENWDLLDYAAQLRAIRRYDVRQPIAEEMQRSAAKVRARMLAVYSWDDHMVTAGAVAEFARMIGADTLSVRSNCGHIMLFCEQPRVASAIRRFLEQ
jgi:homoserine O-acetyltransferase/O-succinyltransferase